MSNQDSEWSSTQEESNQASQAEPYQTPNDVSDQPLRRGPMASPVVWAITGVVVLAAGAFAFAWTRAEEDTAQYIEDFGGYRRGPIEEPIEQAMLDAYESEMQAQSAIGDPSPPAP